jgi:hypothetical protein
MRTHSRTSSPMIRSVSESPFSRSSSTSDGFPLRRLAVFASPVKAIESSPLKSSSSSESDRSEMGKCRPVGKRVSVFVPAREGVDCTFVEDGKRGSVRARGDTTSSSTVNDGGGMVNEGLASKFAAIAASKRSSRPLQPKPTQRDRTH